PRRAWWPRLSPAPDRSSAPVKAGAFAIPGLAGPSDPEHLAAPESFAVPAAPDRDPAGPLDLPRSIPADRCRLLVDAERRHPARRLENDRRGERLGPEVVVRDHGRHRDDP